jgi:hypothetical protein
MEQLSQSGMGAPYRRLQRTCLSTRSLAPMIRIGANKRCRELTLATRSQADARNGGVCMALIKVHGEKDYGAHRLPAGRTAAGKRERGRPAGQAAKLFQDRLLQVSKA